MTQEQKQQALDTAVTQHFYLLFDVLMQSTDVGGIDRFKKGLTNLAEKEKEVQKILDENSSV